MDKGPLVSRTEYLQEWYQENLEENRTKRRESSRLWRARTKEKRREFDRFQAKERYKKNREKILNRNKQWSKANIEKVYAKNAKHRAAKMQRIPIWADLNIIKDIYKNCPEGMHVDHIIPLQGDTVSGLHVETNLQYLSAKENLSKGNRLVEEI